jgi:hypothetical protein
MLIIKTLKKNIPVYINKNNEAANQARMIPVCSDEGSSCTFQAKNDMVLRQKSTRRPYA